MTIADKIIRAKADYDAVFEAGKAQGGGYDETSVQAISDAIQLKNDGNKEAYPIAQMGDAVLDMPFANVPSYHYAEAGRVTKKILDLKALYPNHIVFGTISDNHADLTTPDVLTGARHCAFALESVGAMAQCDFVANLGDNLSGSNIDTDVDLADLTYMENSIRYALVSMESFSLVGNHEKSGSTEKIYDLIGKYNSFDDYGTTKIRGYGYKDFTNKKVRVIALNTCDYWNTTGGNGMSYEQKDFFMKALDLSSKDDYASWTIIVLSHIPLDYLGGDYNKGADLKAILKAYNDGATATITVNSSYANAQNEGSKYSGTLTYNYAGKNAPRIINIHGHIHTNKYRKLIFIDDNAELDIIRVATPNSAFNQNASVDRYTASGDYSITAEEANKIRKVAGTKADTSATFYFLDLDGQIIYSIGYGADIDRTIPYKSATVYGVTYNLSNVSSSNTSTGIAEDDSYTTTLSIGSDCTWDSVTVTMGGVDITSSAYSNGVVTITKVTGDVVITASASVELPYDNLFKTTDPDFVDGQILRSSGGTKDGNGFVSGYIEANYDETIHVRCPSGTSYIDQSAPVICLYDSNKSFINSFYSSQITVDSDNLGFSFTITKSNCGFVRVQGQPTGAHSDFIVTKSATGIITKTYENVSYTWYAGGNEDCKNQTFVISDDENNGYPDQVILTGDDNTGYTVEFVDYGPATVPGPMNSLLPEYTIVLQLNGVSKTDAEEMAKATSFMLDDNNTLTLTIEQASTEV